MPDAAIDEPIADETALRAVSVLGARLRGVTSPHDTPELAAELQRRWEAEGHAPPPPFAPGSLADRAWQAVGAIARRLPVRWQDRVRPVVRRARAIVRR